MFNTQEEKNLKEKGTTRPPPPTAKAVGFRLRSRDLENFIDEGTVVGPYACEECNAIYTEEEFFEGASNNG